MLNINTNPSTIGSLGKLSESQQALATSMTRLSSGNRVNSAKDDPAGLAIIQQFAAQIAGSNQAVRNLNDGISLAQTSEGALSSLSDSTQRLRELAVAAGNSTLSASDRAALQAEADQLSQGNRDIVDQTQFNGQKILQGQSLTLQAGPNAGDTLSFSTNATTLNSNNGRIDLSSPAAASQSLDLLDQDLQQLNDSRGQLGALQSRLDSGISNLQTSSINQSAARSQIGDTDYAAEMARFTQESVRSQAALASRVQANAIPAQVLSLLR